MGQIIGLKGLISMTEKGEGKGGDAKAGAYGKAGAGSGKKGGGKKGGGDIRKARSTTAPSGVTAAARGLKKAGAKYKPAIKGPSRPLRRP